MMASDPTLMKKLVLKPGQQALLLNAPHGIRERLGDLRDGVELHVTDQPEAIATVGACDFALLFVKNQAELARFATATLAALKPGGVLWFAYPKQSARTATDITRDRGWDVVTATGLRPVTQIALDEVWSALRFRPVEDVKKRD